MIEANDLLCITNMAYRTAGRLHNTGNALKVWWHCMVSTACWSIHTGHQAGARIRQHSNNTNECTKDLIWHVRNGVPPVILPCTTSRYLPSTAAQHKRQAQGPGMSHICHIHFITYYDIAQGATAPWTLKPYREHHLGMGLARMPTQHTMCQPTSLVHELKSYGVQGSINDTSAMVHTTMT